MSNPNAQPGEVVELQRSDRNLTIHDTKTLIKTSCFRVIQIRIPEGSTIPTHEAYGDIVIQCLEGGILINASRLTKELVADQMLYLEISEPFTITAVVDSSLIATFVSATGTDDGIIGS